MQSAGLVVKSQQTLPPGGVMIGAKRSCQAPSADSMMTPRLPESHNSGSDLKSKMTRSKIRCKGERIRGIRPPFNL